MELIEREGFVNLLQAKLDNVTKGEGHCIFITGEAGIGKTSLVKEFCKSQPSRYKVYHGACDALFTPRPLAPLYDIIWQVNNELSPRSHSLDERFSLFTHFYRELSQQSEPVIIVFEDLHWADEATLDFIKFFARRITQIRCLFLLTYRDEEVNSHHPLKNMLGQLPNDCFTRMPLTHFSRSVVDKMAAEKGYNGEDVYSLSGGNPFYVTEILSNYSLGMPDSIKDSILSAFNRTTDRTRDVWELLSVLPAGLETKYLEHFAPLFAADIENCLNLKILFIDGKHIYFKHELFRRTIENSLSPLKRVALNKKVLDLLKDRFEQDEEVERIIHHAKNANEYETIVQYAPLAAAQAAAVGAHTESSRLYRSAIEYYQGNEPEVLIRFYEAYSYECYLINEIEDAIIYTGKAFQLWKQKIDSAERMGNSLRFLSRLWWLAGNRHHAVDYALQAIDVLRPQPASAAKAMAFSNMSHLKMLFDEYDESISWGQQAIALAQELGDEETLSHALNNVGALHMLREETENLGREELEQSLSIALKKGLHEHAARAYSNLVRDASRLRNFNYALEKTNEGIQYCEERDLESWRANMLTFKAGILLETGNWSEAYNIVCDQLKTSSNQPAVNIEARVIKATIDMRTGKGDPLPQLLEAAERAFATKECQYIVPTVTSIFQFEWITGNKVISQGQLQQALESMKHSLNRIDNLEFAFWLCKARQHRLPAGDHYAGFDIGSVEKVRKAAAHWEKLHCKFAQAITLYEGDEEDKREAVALLQQLGAESVLEKMKLDMRSAGIKKIPRGIRKSTQANPAQLTARELDILALLKDALQNKEIAAKLFISAKTVDHHISSILYKLEAKSRNKAVQEATRLGILK